VRAAHNTRQGQVGIGAAAAERHSSATPPHPHAHRRHGARTCGLAGGHCSSSALLILRSLSPTKPCCLQRPSSPTKPATQGAAGRAWLRPTRFVPPQPAGHAAAASHYVHDHPRPGAPVDTCLSCVHSCRLPQGCASHLLDQPYTLAQPSPTIPFLEGQVCPPSFPTQTSLARSALVEPSTAATLPRLRLKTTGGAHAPHHVCIPFQAHGARSEPPGPRPSCWLYKRVASRRWEGGVAGTLSAYTGTNWAQARWPRLVCIGGQPCFPSLRRSLAGQRLPRRRSRM